MRISVRSSQEPGPATSSDLSSGNRAIYASPKLLKSLKRGQRRTTRGRIVVALTANEHYRVGKFVVGAKVAKLRKQLRHKRAFSIGSNKWYVFASGPTEIVLQVRHGVVTQIGIANRALARTRTVQRGLLTSW